MSSLSCPSAHLPRSSPRWVRSAMRAPLHVPSLQPGTSAPIRTTRALADVVARVVHARPGAIHPATRTFQALRIFVNEELAELAAALAGRRAHSQAVGTAGRRCLPFARGSHRQVVPERPQPQPWRFAASAGRRCAGADVSHPDKAADRAGRRRDCRQSRARARPSCAPPSAPTPYHSRRSLPFRRCRHLRCRGGMMSPLQPVAPFTVRS